MITKILLLFLLISVNCYGLVLNSYEFAVLEQFFHTMLLQSEGGYVLYNSKPVCIKGFYAVDRFSGENNWHKESVDLREGAIVWKKLIHQKNDDNIIIHIYNQKDSLASEYIHILFINKSLFIQTVKENLPLFQHVLGATITPDQLLCRLTNFNETFHSILKNDLALIGILLGYGTQNSLYGSYTEHLQNQLVAAENPPFKNLLLQCDSLNDAWKKEILLQHHQNDDLQKQIKTDLSASLMQEELSNCFKLMRISSTQLSKNQPQFIFGCLKEDDKTDLLIQNLENAQKDILKLLSSENFLHNVFKIVLPNEPIEVKSSTSSFNMVPKFTANELELLPILIGKGILDIQRQENNDFMRGLILGLNDADSNLPNHFTENNISDYGKIKTLNEAQNNINQANLYFSKLAQDENLTCVYPQKLYYRTIEQGSGAELRTQTEVQIYCKIETPKSIVIKDAWVDKQPIQFNICDAIPGFAWGMKGMKVGETREIFIHPCIGYGIYTLLEKGIYLKACIKLVAILESKSSLEFETLSCYNFDDALTVLQKNDFSEMSKITGYQRGYNIWKHYKQGKYYTLKDVLNWLNKTNANDNNINYESDDYQNLLNRLHWTLYRISEQANST